MMDDKEQAAFQRGYDTGYEAGYVQGRLAKSQEQKAADREAPHPDKLKGNGWVTLTPELRAEFNVPEAYERAYVVRSMDGDIMGLLEVA